MTKQTVFRFIFSAFAALFFSVGSFAAMYGDTYRILILEQGNLSNLSPKEALGYHLLGNIMGIGNVDIGGPVFSSSPGLLNSWRVAQTSVVTAYAFPNPCNLKKGCNAVSFTRLTLSADIKIYTISGEEVALVHKNSSSDTEGWDLKNKSGKYVASGLYIFFIKGDDGSVRKGKLVVIR